MLLLVVFKFIHILTNCLFSDINGNLFTCFYWIAKRSTLKSSTRRKRRTLHCCNVPFRRWSCIRITVLGPTAAATGDSNCHSTHINSYFCSFFFILARPFRRLFGAFKCFQFTSQFLIITTNEREKNNANNWFNNRLNNGKTIGSKGRVRIGTNVISMA